MDTATVDDNFFIEEPRNLIEKFKIKFFDPNSTPEKQMVEILANTKHHLHHDSTNSDRIKQLNRIQTCRLAYNKKLKQLHHQQNATMPKSFITRLESLCQDTYNTGDISIAKSAVDTLIQASKSGCCFLERYIVMLLNFCTKNHHLSDDDTQTIKVEELLSRILIVDFDRQQLIENLKRPECKLTSVEHITKLLQRVQDMLDYREHQNIAINWLLVILDAYFVEIATTDEAVDLIDKISEHIDFQCALLSEIEGTKSLLKSITEHLDNIDEASSLSKNIKQIWFKRPHYYIEYFDI